ncbi:cysteine hydrolase [bacterium]|nr:MAG: cysteine hydrolase [bacterium]
MSSEQHAGPVGGGHVPRRTVLAGAAAGLAASLTALGSQAAQAAENVYADPPKPGLPKTEMQLDARHAALVIIDPQIDFLSPNGVAWGVVGKSVTEHGTVRNIGRLLEAAKRARLPVAVSPHYYYPYDHRWDFGGPLEVLMHKIHMFDRTSPLSLADFEGSGADFMPEYKAQLLDGQTIIASPHKVYGPSSNDLVLQLRKRKVQQVVLAGMSANLCVESHLRELIENGFEVAVVRDATAAARVPEGDGYLAAIINFRYIANALWSTDEAVAFLVQERASAG